MKLFPSKNLSISISGEADDFFKRLESLTEKSRKLITVQTQKPFIGQVNDKGFKIISSTVGVGALAVFELNYIQDKTKLKITLNPPFKILMIVLLTFIFGAVVFNMIKIGLPRGLGLLIPLAMGIAGVRLVLFGLFFRISSNLGIDKIKNVGIVINKEN